MLVTHTLLHSWYDSSYTNKAHTFSVSGDLGLL